MPKTKQQKRQEALARNLASAKDRQVKFRQNMLSKQRGGKLYNFAVEAYGKEYADTEAKKSYDKFVDYFRKRGLDPHGNEL